MKRAAFEHLDAWAAGDPRQPMVLKGARQVGKTWLVREWGRRRFGAVVEANFERAPGLRACFRETDPIAILEKVERVIRQPVPTDGTSLLFLDEVQGAPDVLARLRRFAEKAPRIPVIAAGSFLDLETPGPSLFLEPMGFEEFAEAVGEGRLVARLRRDVTAKSVAPGRTSGGKPPSDAVHARAMRVFREWSLIGGMPAAVEAWRTTRSPVEASARHRDILGTLREDFPKYAETAHHGRLDSVLSSVPRQIGSKFSYREADPEERAAALRRAVDLLCRARVCHRVHATRGDGVALGASVSDRHFRLIHMDVGLASSDLGLTAREFDMAGDVLLVRDGAIVEQAVGQSLRSTFPPNVDPALYWWRREKPGSEAVIDYLWSHGSLVVPIEAKAGDAGHMRSLHLFMAERRLPWAVRVNSLPPSVEDIDLRTTTGRRAKYRLLSIPPYLVQQLPRLLDELR